MTVETTTVMGAHTRRHGNDDGDDVSDVDDDDDGFADPLAGSSSSRHSRATNLPLNIRASRRLHQDEEHDDNNDDDDDEAENTENTDDAQQRPLLGTVAVESNNSTSDPAASTTVTRNNALLPGGLVRVRKSAHSRRKRKHPEETESATAPPPRRRSLLHACLLWCCRNNTRNVQSTISCMNLLAKIIFWSTIMALVGAVFWYSYELNKHGYVRVRGVVCGLIESSYPLAILTHVKTTTKKNVSTLHPSAPPPKIKNSVFSTEAHLIAWFSAGAFVLLGFPISMWGIISHLANYNQPRVQVYIVRILWMVPIYSIESWLAMRYHKKAIYIETLRDFYESYVLYSFLQFLIEVLGGEEALILMLKDKSPTRGFHMWGMQYCIKPWLMGQPVSRTVYETPSHTTKSGKLKPTRAMKRIHWKSPFFMNCKFGVLQYVLLKLLSAIAVLLLEWKGVYKEGEFSWKNGYLYVCIVTNLSQCWALYCLIFFYYATHNELSPIRPVGKFLSVKALVFFTWWQSVAISILYQTGMIPEQLVNKEMDWTEEDVAKGIQDYLICIEMFVAAVVHSFVFPHTEYSPQAVEARNRALNHQGSVWNSRKRLGRSKYHPNSIYTSYHSHKDDASKSSAIPPSGGAFEMVSLDSGSLHTTDTWDDPMLWQPIHPQTDPYSRSRASSIDALGVDPLNSEETLRDDLIDPTLKQFCDEENLATVRDTDEEDDEGEESTDHTSGDGDGDRFFAPVSQPKPGFVRALLDSAIPRDLGDSTIGIVKGEYHVEKKTLLHHATTSDQYDLFSASRRRQGRKDED